MGLEKSYIQNNSSNNFTAGLVARLSSGKIINCYNINNITGGKVTAGLVSYMYAGIIEKCYNTGNINPNGGQFGAGILGYANASNAIIRKCYNRGEISGFQSGGIVGGLLGQCYDCYNIGDITSNSQNGGIVGQLYASTSAVVSNCYNVGSCSGSGIIGAKSGTGEDYTVNNNYYLSGTASTGYANWYNNDDGAESKTEAFMKSDAFVELLGTDNWMIKTGENNGYPVLR